MQIEICDDEKYMMVQSGGSHMKVFLKDIVYAEVYNRKVIIHTRNTDIEYYGKLQELSEILVKPRAIVMGMNIERNLDFRDRVLEYSSKSGIRLLKAQDIKK